MKHSLTRARIEIDLGALRRNGAAIARRAGVPLLPMIKADAYGLGAEAAVRALDPLEPWGYGIATVGEGEELRRLGVTRPIVVFTPLLAKDLTRARAARLTPTLGFPSEIEAWRDAGGGPWHLSIDTGMSRAGIPWREVRSILPLVESFAPEGAFTHFHSAELADGSLEIQQERFRGAIAALPSRPRLLHAANSAAIAREGRSQWDLVRPGIFLYGVGSGSSAAIQPENVVNLRAPIVEIRNLEAGDTVSYDATHRVERPARVATLAVGYADGYPRALSESGSVLVEGTVAPIAGLVTMDMTMIDVTTIRCAVGDAVTLIGRAGSTVLTVERVADQAGMSPYELLTGLRSRVERAYTGAGS
ncbi:MAG TPA: alanine racemase [Gemmatimonadaceae bacterium]|jgi:alanine racemase|nr:alanine racemase [Gemmatimonadaceae bacterium]